MTWLTAGVLIASAGSALDIWTSWRAMRHGLRERAPVMKWLVRVLGWKAALLLNAALSAALIYWLYTIDGAAAGALVLFGAGRLVVAHFNAKKLA